jgi:hypothetical protein
MKPGYLLEALKAQAARLVAIESMPVLAVRVGCANYFAVNAKQSYAGLA